MTTGEVVVTVAGILLSGGLISAIVTWLLGRHKPAIDRQEADIAAEKSNVEMSNSVAAQAMEFAEQLSSRVSVLESHAEKQDRQISSLRRAVADWHSFGRDLHARWPWWRQQETPPPLPTTGTRMEGFAKDD